MSSWSIVGSTTFRGQVFRGTCRSMEGHTWKRRDRWGRDMQGRCDKHLFEAAEDMCGKCGYEFCGECLVYAFGAKKPPFCIPCAVAAAGIRSNAGIRPMADAREL